MARDQSRSLIPQLICLPFGYRVLVKQVPYQEFCHLSGEQVAYWDSTNRWLYLDRDLPLKERRYHLVSQLFHIVLDYQHELLDGHIIEVNE